MKRHMQQWGRGVLATAVAASFTASSALAVEIYYQPIATIAAENNSNLDLDAGPHSNVQGYDVDLATIVGFVTPDSATTIRPRIVYRDYPEESGDDRLEGYFDFNSSYHTQRSQANISGSLQHIDEFNSEYTQNYFDDIAPNQPATGTGRIVDGATRDSVFITPKYVYSFTPTLGAGVSGNYMLVNYSPSDTSSHVDFDYYQGRAFVNWSVTPRSTLSFGGFGSKFETKDVFSQATGEGALADWTTLWTPLLTTIFELNYQRTHLDSVIPTAINQQVNKLGASVDVNYRTETQRFRLIGRQSVSPSGGGAVYLTDRLQFQYDRDVTARFSVTGAASGIRTRGLTEGLSGYNRSYADTTIEAHYMLTRYFFVQGGYQYAWQKYTNDPESASNNRIYVSFGYKGLGQQR